MSSILPSFSSSSKSNQVRFDQELSSYKSSLDTNTQNNPLNSILKEHKISTPINKLGDLLIAEIKKADKSPAFLAHESLMSLKSSYEELLNQLKGELSAKQCDWHHARNLPDWAENSKGQKYDFMRCKIKEAMAQFAADVTEEITGNSGRYKDFGTQGYKSDIDLTYIPDQKNKDFKYASGKLIFDALFAATFNRTPEDLFDLEVYVQHPGKSMHTGEMIKTDGGKIGFLTAEIQAAFQKIKDPELAEELQSALCKDANDETTEVGVKEIMQDIEYFNASMQEFKDATLSGCELSDTDKEDIYSPKHLEYKFADASYRDTLIYSIYQDHIQKFQEQIQKLQDDMVSISSRANSMQSTASFTNSVFNMTLEAMENDNHSNNRNDYSEVQNEPSNSSTAQKSPENSPTKLQSVRSRFAVEALSADLNRSSSSSEDDLQIATRIESFTRANKPLFQSPRIEIQAITQTKSDLNIIPSEPSFAKPTLPLILTKRQSTLNSALSSAGGPRLSRYQTGFSYDQIETPVSFQQAALRRQIDELYVRQARYATITESLTKEGFNTQGALRDIVENRDGQEDSKHAKQILEKLFFCEAQDKVPPKNVQQLLDNRNLSPDFLQKIAQPKAASSHSSLLNSALENYHFYAAHLRESLNKPQKAIGESPWSNSVINESKYEMRFAAKALAFYKELSKSKILRSQHPILGLRRLDTDPLHRNSELEKLSSKLSKDSHLRRDFEDLELQRSVSSVTTSGASLFANEIEELEDLLESAENLEKMKRSEQLPLIAFEAKLAKLDSLFSSEESMEAFIEVTLKDLPKLSSPRLGDIVAQTHETNKSVKINPQLVTNMGYYKEMLSKLSDESGPFQTQMLKVGTIQIPILKIRSDSMNSEENIQKVRDLNSWAMATSGFPASFYTLPQLTEKDIEEHQHKTFESISATLSAKGDACKDKIFKEAREEILKLNNFDTFEGVKEFYDNINRIYGQLARNAFTSLKLLQDPDSYQKGNSLSEPFEAIKKQLLTASNRG